MDELVIGATVHYVLSNGEHRTAIVVRVFDQYSREAGLANLMVFSDGSNDRSLIAGDVSAQGIFWATSVHYESEGQTHHSWHWTDECWQ